eukprot:4344957-Pleurochrysis_carterae.AAC.1
MLGTDNDGNFFSLDSSLYIFSENDDGDYDNDSADSFGEAERNAVTTDADLFGVIPPPASANAAWTDNCCNEIDMCPDLAVLNASTPAQPSLGIAILQGLRAVVSATRSAFFFILLLLLQAASPMPIIPAATSTASAYSAIPPRTICGSRVAL